MNLLDTQLVLWAALLPERLKPRTRRMIEDRDQVVAFSHVTGWVAIKSSLGRTDFKVDAKALYTGLLQAGLSELPVLPAHLFAVAELCRCLASASTISARKCSFGLAVIAC